MHIAIILAISVILSACGKETVSINKSKVEVKKSVPKVVSLSVGNSFPVLSGQPQDLVWTSDNPLVAVDANGVLSAVSDAISNNGKAIISASKQDGTLFSQTYVTIVNWVANRSGLILVDTPKADNILLVDNNSVYFSKDFQLMVSNDGMQTKITMGTLPDIPQKLLKTPYGFFLRTTTGIYRSSDLINWSHEFSVRAVSLWHTFSYYYDVDTKICYLYTGEYNVNPDDKHAVYRGKYFPDKNVEWAKVLEFDSLTDWTTNPGSLNIARHVHVVDVDPYTGHVWVATGDYDLHARIMYSDDHGDTFRTVGIGEQKWRTLSIWFTETHIYWNMDSSVSQSIWRIPRSVYAASGKWPVMTPELSSGTTIPGQKYLVTASSVTGHFPVSVVHSYTETVSRTLGSSDRVLSLNDPSYLYLELVAKLDNGSQWYHCWATTSTGDKILIMGASPEGAIRDWNGRVFGIKERLGMLPDVQELLSIQSNKPDTYIYYTQLEPRGQSASGDIYFIGRGTTDRIYKMKLKWNDQ
ncbi:MAG: hypothetical protein PHI31_07730 [Desulfuromonadaceae bacterium]|nr:hypothetical protein [Desulfuromonadaceae bacterium]